MDIVSGEAQAAELLSDGIEGLGAIFPTSGGNEGAGGIDTASIQRGGKIAPIVEFQEDWILVSERFSRSDPLGPAGKGM